MTNRDLVTKTLDALVAEAYQIALDRGLAITNPDAWRAWKRRVYADTARREGPGYLRKHHQRLGLAAASRPPAPTCDACKHQIIGSAWTRDDQPGSSYCSATCAGFRTMTLAEWLDQHATPEQRAGMERVLNNRRQEGAA